MIVDKLQTAQQYESLHPLFPAAFQFLREANLTDFVEGKREIDGDRLFVVASREPGKGREKSLLEYHQKFIDIQYVIEGTDTMGWYPTEHCERISQEYDPSSDLGFFFDRPATWIDVPPGYFAIFYPGDAHAPMAGDSLVHKVIVKIAVQ